MGLWLARDDEGWLELYEGEKPERKGMSFVEGNGSEFISSLDCLSFPEVTWENSPVELVPKFVCIN